MGLPQRLGLAAAFLCLLFGSASGQSQPPVELGRRRELFLDRLLIDRLEGARLVLHHPVEREVSFRFDQPWDSRFSAYCTVLRDGPLYRLYYRGVAEVGANATNAEVTCLGESDDGIRWRRPELGLFEAKGTRKNNIVLAGAAPVSHNFAPFVDSRPGVAPGERYKALGGSARSGLIAWASPDGVRWRRMRDEPVITAGAFDSQNVAFWSQHEGRYVCYFRTFKKVDGVDFRWVSRATSQDFIQWSAPVEMNFGGAPPEQIYTNQTHAYFRAPHIYIATAARFMPGRQVVTEEQARGLGVHPDYYRDTSDAVLMSSRGGDRYDRTFVEGFVRPGIGLANWVSRTNYPARGVVQTGPDEMSVYIQQNYGQPTALLRRYSLRLDGFSSVQAPYSGGELVTRPLTFTGKQLLLNFSTSAAGSIRVELQNPQGQAISGFSLADCQEIIGNEIERAVTWRGSDVARLAGRPVRLRFVMKDADLYALQFQ